jgi:hypothetical protein
MGLLEDRKSRAKRSSGREGKREGRKEGGRRNLPELKIVSSLG